MATIGFSTKFPWGEQTNFIGKIWQGLYDNDVIGEEELNNYFHAGVYRFPKIELPLIGDIQCHELTSKIHTIREDGKDLWHPGRKIHPVIFNRTKNRFQFAPVLECKAVQEIGISHRAEKFEDWILKPVVKINKRILLPVAVLRLAWNDGFDGIPDFFQWFNKDFEGKIIHWTEYKY